MFNLADTISIENYVPRLQIQQRNPEHRSRIENGYSSYHPEIFKYQQKTNISLHWSKYNSNTGKSCLLSQSKHYIHRYSVIFYVQELSVITSDGSVERAPQGCNLIMLSFVGLLSSN